MESQKHKELKREAVEWLFKQGCSVISEEVGFKGDIYDAVGVKNNGVAYCVEAKASQKDLKKERQKNLPNYSYKRVFTFYYLILPPELEADWSYDGWGIIKNGIVVKKAKRFENYDSFSGLMELIFKMAWNLSWRVYEKSA